MNNNCLSSAFNNRLYDNDNCSMNNREMLFLLLQKNKWSKCIVKLGSRHYPGFYISR